MSTLKHPEEENFDSEAAAVAEFKDEGAFLLRAGLAAEALERRIDATHPNVKVFHITRDELAELSTQFKRAVEIGRDYHLGAADTAA